MLKALSLGHSAHLSQWEPGLGLNGNGSQMLAWHPLPALAACGMNSSCADKDTPGTAFAQDSLRSESEIRLGSAGTTLAHHQLCDPTPQGGKRFLPSHLPPSSSQAGPVSGRVFSGIMEVENWLIADQTEFHWQGTRQAKPWLTRHRQQTNEERDRQGDAEMKMHIPGCFQ